MKKKKAESWAKTVLDNYKYYYISAVGTVKPINRATYMDYITEEVFAHGLAYQYNTSDYSIISDEKYSDREYIKKIQRYESTRLDIWEGK